MTEGKVHGGTSVWQSVKSFGRALPAWGAHPSKPEPSSRLDVHANSAVADRAASYYHRTSSSPEGEDHRGAGQDAAAPQPPAAPSFGYSRALEQRFRVKREIARGGNGVVTLVEDIHTGQEWAMKSVPKVLTDPSASARKREGHAAAVRREVEVLRRLRGCLNVASLEEVYEDDARVHMVMELCRGGELHHRIGAAHYSERTVASFLRATLRTLAQCHANKILHRDVKPGNFLLSSDDDNAPLKAVDFGLAVFFEDAQLPRGDLGFEGTPWYMAPEVSAARAAGCGLLAGVQRRSRVCAAAAGPFWGLATQSRSAH
jgi:hypothetical protein